MRITIACLSLVTMVGMPSLGSASTPAPWFEGGADGWYWYENPPVIEEPIEKKAPEPKRPVPEMPAPVKPEPVPEGDGLAPLSAAWFREHLDTYRDRALDDPSSDNVAVYLYLQRIALDKATRFSDTARNVVFSDPLLDENTRRPTASFGTYANDQVAGEYTREVFNAIAQVSGIWFFFDTDCPVCSAQFEVMQGLSNLSKMPVHPISLDGTPPPASWTQPWKTDSGQAKKLGILRTPALYLVRPETKEILSLGQGGLSVDALRERTINIAYQAGWVSEQDYQRTRSVSHALTLDQIAVDDPEIFDDPVRLLQQLKATSSQRN